MFMLFSSPAGKNGSITFVALLDLEYSSWFLQLEWFNGGMLLYWSGTYWIFQGFQICMEKKRKEVWVTRHMHWDFQFIFMFVINSKSLRVSFINKSFHLMTMAKVLPILPHNYNFCNCSSVTLQIFAKCLASIRGHAFNFRIIPRQWLAHFDRQAHKAHWSRGRDKCGISNDLFPLLY